MSSTRSRALWACALAVPAAMYGLAQPAEGTRKPADLHTALAITQAHLYGTTGVTARADRIGPSADVLMLISNEHWATVRSSLAANGMVVQFEDARSGYIRATVPLTHVRLPFEWSEVDAVRVDGLAGFDTRLQPQSLETSLGFADSNEPRRDPMATLAAAKVPSRPLLTWEAARQYPFNTDRDMGIMEFRAANPTFDGRGVGIGVLESTWLPIDQPAYATARALDGRPRRKVLRYLDHAATRYEALGASFSDWFNCTNSICQVQGRTIRLPAAGRYRMADVMLSGRDVGARRGVPRYVVLQREDTSHLYVDVDADFDFLKEHALTDFNADTWDSRSIVSLPYIGAEPIKAVVTVDSGGQFVRLHPFSGSHVTMTTTVAAGADVETNFGVGVAPGASLVVVDLGPRTTLLSHALEGAITLARNEDVDLLYASFVVQTPLGTSESFDAKAFDRISEGYNKPIVISAGNYVVPLAASPAPGGRVTMAVGQYVSAQTIEALIGVKRTAAPEIASTVGPAFDGAPRPDFIAATKRVAAEPCDRSVPPVTIQYRLPPCYVMSNGTSAASPSAAGAIALLISAAKQRQLKLSVHQIREALLASATLMPGVPPHMQGAGLISVARAWQHLEQRSVAPMLDVEGELRYRFSDFLGPVRPRGLLLVTQSDKNESMTVTLRGPSRSISEQLSVRSEGSLRVAAPGVVTLDRSGNTRVPVTITPPQAGRVGSSWLFFSDTASGAVVARALATTARPIAVAAPRYEHQWKEDVEFESHSDVLVSLPTGATGVLLEADLSRGDGHPALLNPVSLPVLPPAYWSGGPFFSTPVISPPGHYAGVVMEPAAGDWGVVSAEESSLRVAWRGATQLAERLAVSLRMTAFRTVCALDARVKRGSTEHVRVSVDDLFAKPVNARVLAAPATVRTEHVTLNDEFERRAVTLDVKPETAAFHVEARQRKTDAIVLQLFDCTQGYCRSVIQTVPGEESPRLTVRQPRAGIWKVFAVPVRPLYTSTVVDVTVTQALEANITPLTPVQSKTTSRSGAQMFEGDVPASPGASSLLLFRTDERASINKEGWGAISMCLVQDPTQNR